LSKVFQVSGATALGTSSAGYCASASQSSPFFLVWEISEISIQFEGKSLQFDPDPQHGIRHFDLEQLVP